MDAGASVAIRKDILCYFKPPASQNRIYYLMSQTCTDQASKLVDVCTQTGFQMSSNLQMHTREPKAKDDSMCVGDRDPWHIDLSSESTSAPIWRSLT